MSLVDMIEIEEHKHTISSNSEQSAEHQPTSLTNLVPTSTSISPTTHLQNSPCNQIWQMHGESSEISSMELTAAAALCSQKPCRKGYKKHSPAERLQRSRERNRIHARKTRQRKKEQMHTLQSHVEELRDEQNRLKQAINEKHTASILVGLFATEVEQRRCSTNGSDPLIEELLLRPSEDIPDSAKIPESPTLIPPGNHEKTRFSAGNGFSQISVDVSSDGIDYELLGKDRSKCSAEELDLIRRERNRMHAKRTRDRKRLFLDKMDEMCKRLEHENELLRNHLASLDGAAHSTSESLIPSLVSPSLAPCQPLLEVPDGTINEGGTHSTRLQRDASTNEDDRGKNHLTQLLEVAGSFCQFSGSRGASSVASAISTSSNTSVSDSGPEDQIDRCTTLASPRKRRHMESSSAVMCL